jgi:hypothetical protein
MLDRQRDAFIVDDFRMLDRSSACENRVFDSLRGVRVPPPSTRSGWLHRPRR